MVAGAFVNQCDCGLTKLAPVDRCAKCQAGRDNMARIAREALIAEPARSLRLSPECDDCGSLFAMKCGADDRGIVGTAVCCGCGATIVLN